MVFSIFIKRRYYIIWNDEIEVIWKNSFNVFLQDKS